MPSITSLVSLPSVPIEPTPRARAPGSGPRPKIGTMMTIAKMTSGTVRMALSTCRVGTTIQRGAVLEAARNPIGNDSRAPITVPTHAIASDCPMNSSEVSQYSA